MSGNMTAGIAEALKIQSLACHDLIHVNDNRNTEFYKNTEREIGFNVAWLSNKVSVSDLIPNHWIRLVPS